MCGRYAHVIPQEFFIENIPGLTFSEETIARYNAAPSQAVPVILNDGERVVRMIRWGLIPFFASDPKIGDGLINARAETLAEKPSFRTLIRKRRCLMLAAGFFEWKKVPGQRAKVPYYFVMKDRRPFAFGGLWDVNKRCGPDPITSCTIITTTPNSLMAAYHHRMPVIVPPAHYLDWIEPSERAAEELQSLLVPYPAEQMEAFAVSTQVNRPSNEGPSLIEPAPPD